MTRRYITGANAALFTDQYQLTMMQAYLAEGLQDTWATFSLFVRRLPTHRNYLLAAGLDDVLAFLETLRFGEDDLAYLHQQGLSSRLLGYLERLRFSGDVHALPEGTPFFAEEPILEVEAPIAQAQLLETYVMNQVHSQTLLASKAARVREAAGGRPVLDFGLRRIHGADGGLKAARAFHIAGLAGTSNVLAGRVYGIPISGTMAHSYVQAHDDELDAFRAFTREHPETVLLVDTYDTLEGVRKVVRLAKELGDGFRVRGVRLDSGDLAALAKQARHILDEAGLQSVKIFASGGLTENNISKLLAEGAPIDGFGVGTSMGVSDDAPQLDIAYKLTAFGGRGRLKLSSGKRILPGRKQIFRQERDGYYTHDVLAREGEEHPGRPLLRKVMEGGERTADGIDTLRAARERAAASVAKLPPRARGLDPADPVYEVRISDALEQYWEAVKARVRREE